MAQSTSPLQRQGTHRTRTCAHQEHESGVQLRASRVMHITHAATRPRCSSSGMPRAACAHQGSRDQDAADDVHDGRARAYVGHEHGRRVGRRRQRHHRQPAPAAPLYLRRRPSDPAARLQHAYDACHMPQTCRAMRPATASWAVASPHQHQRRPRHAQTDPGCVRDLARLCARWGGAP